MKAPISNMLSLPLLNALMISVTAFTFLIDDLLDFFEQADYFEREWALADSSYVNKGSIPSTM